MTLPFLVLAAVAQDSAGAETPLTTASLERARGEARRNTSLSEDQRDQITDLYSQALESLATERRLQASARRLERERVNAGRETQVLQQRLDRPREAPSLDLPDNASLDRIKQHLTQERAELEARRQALSDLIKLAESRAGRRTEISSRIGTLRQQAESVSDQIQSLPHQEIIPEVKDAARASLRARLRAIQQEITTLRSEQELLDARADLLPLRRDRAERRLAETERLVEILMVRSEQSQRAEIERSLAEVRQMGAKARELSPVLEELAAETENFAGMLWTKDTGVVDRLETTTRQLTAVEKHMADVQRISASTRRKFEAVRLHGISAQWWPDIPEDLPQPAELRAQIRRRESLLANAQHEAIVLEETRAEVGNIGREVNEYVERVRQIDPSIDASQLERAVRTLVAKRRDLVDQLNRNYSRYADRLFDLDVKSRNLLAEITVLDEYITSRVFWVRSVPGPKIPPGQDVSGGLRWLLLNRGWGRVLHRALEQFGSDLWLILLFWSLLALLFMRPRMEKLLETQARQSGSAEAGGPVSTLIAMGLTAALASQLPLALFGLGWFFEGANEYDLGRGLSAACYSMAGLSFLLLLMSQACRPNGLARAHFGWDLEATALARKHLRWLIAVLLPLGFVAAALGEDGLRFHSQPDLRAYSNGLGRLCFMLSTAALTFAAHRILHPEGLVAQAVFRHAKDSWSSRLRHFWFAVLLGLSLLPGVLASQGYYLSGYVVLALMLRTLLLIVILALVGEMLVQWRTSKQRHLALVRKRAAGGREDEVEAEVRSAESQVRQLTRFSLGFIGLVVFMMIWSDVLPALQLLDRIQLSPSFAVLQADQLAEDMPFTTPGARAGAPEPLAAETAEPAVNQPAGAAMPDPAAADTSESGKTLRLSDVLKALLVLIFTFIIAKNIPGLLEFTVLRKMPIEQGARTATSTLVRYFLTIVGISVATGMVGLSWQKIQWLAAALTFGLGFGLQEIFANFVSGLIILVDRPIRIGDVVTVGDIGGWVTRISIRATTITKWDRSELIVPNKEFITGQLTNWTLSNQLTRVELKVGVTYGSDVEKVRQVLLDVANKHPAVLPDPPSYVVLMEFGASSIDFELRVYLNYEYGRLTIRDELHRQIVEAFDENGITIAFPQLDIHVKSDGREPIPPKAPKRLPSGKGKAPEGLQDED